MPFFIKGKRKKQATEKDVRKVAVKSAISDRKYRNKTEKMRSNEEIDSDAEEDLTLKNEYKYSSESEMEETIQEKRLRLARNYLEEIQREEEKRMETQDIDKEIVNKRLKENYLEKTGRLRKNIADSYTHCGDNLVLKCKEHSRSITCIVVSSDQQYLFSASDDFNIVKWSLKHRQKEGVIKRTDIKGHKKKILALALSCDNQFLASGGCEATVKIWNPENLTHLHTFNGHKIDVTGLAFRKNSHQLFSCSSDKSLKLWNLDDMAYVETLYGHSSGITSIDVLAKDRAVTSGGRDSSIRIWKIAEESHLILNGYQESIDCVKLLNENNCISGSDSGNICLWSNLKKKPIFTLLEAHGVDSSSKTPNWILSLATFAYADFFASGSCNGVINFYKCNDRFKSFEKCMEANVEGNINCMAFTQDGKYLVVGVGQEHKMGRWQTIKTVENAILLIPLIRKKISCDNTN